MEHVRNFYDTILKSSHPLLLAVHLAGKVIPILFYLLGSLFVGFTTQFIVVVIALALDFYITKNISGRKLVQLRWWYDPTATGSGKTFRFESYKQYAPGPQINPIDSRLFWWSMYITPAVWIFFALSCILRLKPFYLLLVTVGLLLTGWDTYGFRLCDRWEPRNGEEASSNTTAWFQLPNWDNMAAIARVQSFFQGRP